MFLESNTISAFGSTQPGMGRGGGVGAWVVVLLGGVAIVVLMCAGPRVGGVVLFGVVRVGAFGVVVDALTGGVNAVVVLRWNLRVGDVL